MESYNHELFIKSTMIEDLNKAISESYYDLEGNCLYEHFTTFVEFEKGFLWDNKNILRENLFKIAKRCETGLEVGFNGGHSAAIYFFAKPQLKLLTFDICHHGYTIPCVNVLKNKYNCNIELVVGSSQDTIPYYKPSIKYDFIHIDGCHIETIVESDLVNCKKFAHEKTYLIMDDISMPPIKNVVDKYISKGELIEIDYEKENLEKNYFHRIYRYVL